MDLRLHLLNLVRLLLLATMAGLSSAASCSTEAHAATPQPALFVIALDGQLNLNTATARELELLPGVGPATSAKIISYRERHPFRSIRQLMRIKGIGSKRFGAMRPYLAIEGETTLSIASP